MLLKVLLFFIAFLVGADELMLGPILVPIGYDLGVQPERVTLFITAYSVALAIVAPALGVLSDRLGRMRVMLPAALLFGAASIATGLVSSFEWGLTTRILTGIASAGMLPIAFAMAADASTNASNDAMTRIAWVQSGLTLGMISSPALGALLAEWLSWRAAFMVLGVCAWCVAGALAVVFVRSKTVEAPAIHDGDEKVTKIWAIPGATGALLAMFFGLGGGIGLFNLIGQHLRDTLGMSIWSVGVMYAVLGGSSVIGNMLMPRVAGRLESGRQVMRLALIVCLIVSIGFYLYPAQQLLVLILPLVMWSLAGGVGSPALQSYIAQLSNAHRGILMSLAMTMMHLGVAIWSGVAGFAYSVGPIGMAILATLLFGAAIAVLRPVKQAQ
ncbi:MFS transporter [Shewanella baltica]|uniref:Major facilitator superfamily MFS_1 n=1 Tax=Shewanella baltica (strain OS195) TaxID=399599 RepID=A9KV22_SHEB9|nr:MFS transporter [Shewanella baltica]ABX51521.1 major facilitator superfamily MFS_1 [Shewanella baltica OS195]ADT96520.1 major facilitator superfamily MFS_1 [Shewanella baltica OS678]MCS6178491.1 MFS transporter [Shewanella baltica]MCS6204852.1 MFS transporter [Shewanella baltica]MCS6254637.1 MFS transporter [Shewanella baltica]